MMKRILIVKMWAMGDVVMATPMLDAIKKFDPAISIAWLIDQNNVDLVINHPLIDEVIPVDTNAWRQQLKRGELSGWLKTGMSLTYQMKSRNFDAVINCHPDKWWTALFCRAKSRVALYPFAAPPLSRLIYTTAIGRPKEPPVHNTVHYLLATRALGIPDGSMAMDIGGSEGEAHVPRDPQHRRLSMLVAPISTGENRNWPLERYRELIDWLVSALGAKVVLAGGTRELERLNGLAGEFDESDVVVEGHLSVAEYIEAVRRSDLVVSGDSSPMHLAAATGVPFVALFGATPVDERFPLVGRGKAVYKKLHCSPCDLATCANPEFRKCMNLIELSDVQDAIESVLTKYGLAMDWMANGNRPKR